MSAVLFSISRGTKASSFWGCDGWQALFEEYMPAGAVHLLQENNCWESPYSYQHPVNLKLMARSLPDNCSMLCKTYADVKNSVDNV